MPASALHHFTRYAIPAEAHAVLESVARSVRGPSWSAPKARRRARLVTMLCAAALDATQSERSRQMRWRRLVRVLASTVEAASSPTLARIVSENLDLLASRPRAALPLVRVATVRGEEPE